METLYSRTLIIWLTWGFAHAGLLNWPDYQGLFKNPSTIVIRHGSTLNFTDSNYLPFCQFCLVNLVPYCHFITCVLVSAYIIVQQVLLVYFKTFES